jgi:hypothetical protein
VRTNGQESKASGKGGHARNKHAQRKGPPHIRHHATRAHTDRHTHASVSTPLPVCHFSLSCLSLLPCVLSVPQARTQGDKLARRVGLQWDGVRRGCPLY